MKKVFEPFDSAKEHSLTFEVNIVSALATIYFFIIPTASNHTRYGKKYLINSANIV